MSNRWLQRSQRKYLLVRFHYFYKVSGQVVFNTDEVVPKRGCAEWTATNDCELIAADVGTFVRGKWKDLAYKHLKCIPFKMGETFLLDLNVELGDH